MWGMLGGSKVKRLLKTHLNFRMLPCAYVCVCVCVCLFGLRSGDLDLSHESHL